MYHNIALKSRKLASIVQQCRDIPGKELFQYYDANGTPHSVDSGEVNEYLKEISNGEFTSKDFRTWTGTVQCLISLSAYSRFSSATEMKRNITAAIDAVAACLGNTRTVCKNHYIHPLVLTLYEQQKLERYLNKLKQETAAATESVCEKLLLQLLCKQ